VRGRVINGRGEWWGRDAGCAETAHVSLAPAVLGTAPDRPASPPAVSPECKATNWKNGRREVRSSSRDSTIYSLAEPIYKSTNWRSAVATPFGRARLS
jgi:hypothetical protein